MRRVEAHRREGVCEPRDWIQQGHDGRANNPIETIDLLDAPV